MAKIQQPDGSLVIRKSFWSAISIWWGIIVFLIGLPVAGILLMEESMIYLAVGAVSFVVTLIVLIIKKIIVKKTTWTFYNGAVVYKKGRVFYTEENTRDMEFFPGMSVTVRRTIKGKLFGYGDVVLSNGAGEAGEIVMLGVKRPKKVQKHLREMITANCTYTANMMSPYKMYPQMYRHVLGGYPAYYYGTMQGSVLPPKK
ncbi:MAG: PH domain-containing protein [Clostridia bacterium]|nr:PH domain-containing protein [Clostridia bacterium]